MRHHPAGFLLLVLSAACSLQAEDLDLASTRAKHLALGVQLGDPTEITAKYFLSEVDAVAGGFGVGNGSDYELHGDVLRHFPGLIEVKQGKLPLYVGAGGRMRQRDDDHGSELTLDARGTGGIAYWFAKLPLELYGEVNPVMDLFHDGELDVKLSWDWGIGGRWYF